MLAKKQKDVANEFPVIVESESSLKTINKKEKQSIAIGSYD